MFKKIFNFTAKDNQRSIIIQNLLKFSLAATAVILIYLNYIAPDFISEGKKITDKGASIGTELNINHNELNKINDNLKIDLSSSKKNEPLTIKKLISIYEKKYGMEFINKSEIKEDYLINSDLLKNTPEVTILQILNGYNFNLYFKNQEKGISKLKIVEILSAKSKSSSRLSGKIDYKYEQIDKHNNFVEELKRAMNLSQVDAEEFVSKALNDEDANTRNNVLQIAEQEGVSLPSSIYEKLLYDDPSEIVRASAFDAIIQRSEAENIDLQSLIDAALDDPSPLIQERAHALREALQSSETISAQDSEDDSQPDVNFQQR